MLKYFVFILFLIGSKDAFSQSEGAFFTALKSGDMTSIDVYLQENIDFCLFEDQQILSKKVAMERLKAFLNTHKISSIEVMHKGVAKDKKSQYKVAKLTTPKEVFRVFVYSMGEIGSNNVKEIRIDKF